MADIDRERRRKTRYPVKDSSAVLLSPDNIISYALLDISESGLAFAYNGPGAEVILKSHGTIDLFGEIALVSDVKIRIISDSPLLAGETRYVEGGEEGDTLPYLRRCGVEFVDMGSGQSKVITGYLQTISKG